MDRVELSAAIIADAQAVLKEELARELPALLESDLGQIERTLQQVSRRLWGQVVSAVGAARVAQQAEGTACARCGGRLHRIAPARRRQVQGLLGDYVLERPYDHCRRCRQGEASLDTAWALGRGSLSPELARVVCRSAVSVPFAEAAAVLAETLGVALSADTVEQVSAQMGAVAEAATQTAMARVQEGHAPEAVVTPEAPPPTGILAVAVDGVQVHRDDGWHEMKVVTLAPLGPELHQDPASGRSHLAWGQASYGAGFEEAETFWYRVAVEAARRGLGTPAVHTVVVLGDGADWIWHRARAFLGARATVVEIVDLYHAYEYLWRVGHALYSAGTLTATDWVEARKAELRDQGAPAVLASLTQVQERAAAAGPEAQEALRVAQGYLTTHAARMDYPRFAAQQYPLGSGAVESACKCVVEARAKGAGMRWSRAGAQRVLSLRAVLRSGRWATFWQQQPQRQYLHLCPRQPHRSRQPAVPPLDAPQEDVATAPPTGSVAAAAAPAPPAPRPLPPPRRAPTRAQRPLLLPRSA